MDSNDEGLFVRDDNVDTADSEQAGAPVEESSESSNTIAQDILSHWCESFDHISDSPMHSSTETDASMLENDEESNQEDYDERQLRLRPIPEYNDTRFPQEPRKLPGLRGRKTTLVDLFYLPTLGAVDQCEKAGLLDTSSGTEAVPRSRAETDWPDAVQDLETGQVAVPGRRRPTRRLDWCGRFVFSVGFLADVLEWISLWYIRSSGMGAFAGSVASAAAIDATTFNWVLKLFLDVGAPDRVLLSYYEQLYREQPERLYREGWTLHLLQSMLTIITIWKKHAISPRTGKDQNAEFAAGGRGSDEAGVDLDAVEAKVAPSMALDVDAASVAPSVAAAGIAHCAAQVPWCQ
ncbi:hypothetical protein GN958_ATG08310 [Phytophthora infestans]|nr:hypothetical protein GN958_ATG19605 [Phytophthora infestans]KAF4141415.1 hypothetical protein GN958_ATG09386 [Phytophthora infestans]KAF4142501.1 hypothetical protein GN958_ATG08310 [Phytophthora infestans]